MNAAVKVLPIALALSGCSLNSFAVFDPYRAERTAGEPFFITAYDTGELEDTVAADGSSVQSVVLYIERNTAVPRPMSWEELGASVSLSCVERYDIWRNLIASPCGDARELWLIGNVRQDSAVIFPVTVGVISEPDSVLRRWVYTGAPQPMTEPTPSENVSTLLSGLRRRGIRTAGADEVMVSLNESQVEDAHLGWRPVSWRTAVPRQASAPSAEGVPSAFTTADWEGAERREKAFLRLLDLDPPTRVPLRLVCTLPSGEGVCFEPGRRYRLRVQRENPLTDAPPADFTFLIEKRDARASFVIGSAFLGMLVLVMTY